MTRFGGWFLALLLMVVGSVGCEVRAADPKVEANQFAAFYNARDMARILDSYTDDVVFQPLEGPPIEGKAAVEAYYKSTFEKYPDIQISAVSAQVENEAQGVVRVIVQWSSSGGGVSSFKTVSKARQAPDSRWLVFHTSLPFESDTAETPRAGACARDADCPGEQICDAGACVAQ